MKLLVLLLRLAFWWPVGRFCVFLEWLFGRPFIPIYIGGFICWFYALYTIGHHLEAVISLDYTTLPVLACMFLMFGACFPSRLSRILLVPLMVAVEMLFLFTGHHFFFYKIATLFSIGFLLILYGEKIAMRCGMLKLERPDRLDNLIHSLLGFPLYEGKSIQDPAPCMVFTEKADHDEPPIPQTDLRILRLRHVMKAYLAAPIGTRHLAAQQAGQEFDEIYCTREARDCLLTRPLPELDSKSREAVNRDGEAIAEGMRNMPADYKVPY